MKNRKVFPKRRAIVIPCGLGLWFHVGNICQRECVGKENGTLIVGKINGSICFKYILYMNVCVG